ncbi:sensor domain-containing diguanylate cyclase [Helicovermis profundi]|uniref:GGDEF domain-containing protein n=1 Tax=Helicovermis profundi TaxID=3065157 RepID=A0AAU9EE99_9FIRM|nr:hypothetical protein HLPR_00690 [Clostridia bacterium S502]
MKKTVRFKDFFIIFVIIILSSIIVPYMIFTKYIFIIQISLILLSCFTSYFFIKNFHISPILDSENNNLRDISNAKIKNALFDISDLIMNSLNSSMSEVHKKVLEYAIELIEDAQAGSIACVSSDDYVEFITSKGYNNEKLKGVKFKKEKTFLWVYSKNKPLEPIIVNNTTEFNNTYLGDENIKTLKEASANTFKSTLTSPIFIDDKVIEVLNIDSFNENAFTEEDKKIINIFTSLIGITLKNRALLEEANFLSSHDKLTEIYNRRFFEKEFLNFQEKAFKENHPFSIVLCDLNYLKKINDNFGHIAGDEAIISVVNAINSEVSKDDIFARYGGDEFIILFSNSNKSDSEAKMKSIFDNFDNFKLKVAGGKVPIQFSYGISSAPDESIMLDILVKIADQRMYTHKRELKETNKTDPNFASLIK